MTDMPELWWAEEDCWLRCPDGEFMSAGLSSVLRETLPDDAILLVPAEPVDAKGRTPTYIRGFADGQMAARAAFKAAGLTDEEVFSLEAYFAIDWAVRADDQPPPG